MCNEIENVKRKELNINDELHKKFSLLLKIEVSDWEIGILVLGIYYE